MNAPIDAIHPLLLRLNQALIHYATSTHTRIDADTTCGTLRFHRDAHHNTRLLWCRGSPVRGLSAHQRVQKEAQHHALWAMMEEMAGLLSTIPLLDHPHHSFEVKFVRTTPAQPRVQVILEGCPVHTKPVQLSTLMGHMRARLARLQALPSTGPFLPFQVGPHPMWAPSAELALAKWAVLTQTPRSRPAHLDHAACPPVSLILDPQVLCATTNILLHALPA